MRRTTTIPARVAAGTFLLSLGAAMSSGGCRFTNPSGAPEIVECGGKRTSFLDWIHLQWVALAKIEPTAEQVARMTANGGTPRPYTQGNGNIATDFIGVTVQLPEGMSHTELLTLIRDDPGALAGGGTDFTDEVGWPADPDGREAGDVIDLDIWGPDNGSIGYLDVDVNDGLICVMVVTTADAGTHPVSGTRCWGYAPLASGETLFYTVGIDATNAPPSGFIGGPLQRETWTAMMEAIAEHVQQAGGKADRIYYDTEWQPGSLTPATAAPSTVDRAGVLDGWYLAPRSPSLVQPTPPLAPPPAPHCPPVDEPVGPPCKALLDVDYTSTTTVWDDGSPETLQSWNQHRFEIGPDGKIERQIVLETFEQGDETVVLLKEWNATSKATQMFALAPLSAHPVTLAPAVVRYPPVPQPGSVWNLPIAPELSDLLLDCLDGDLAECAGKHGMTSLGEAEVSGAACADFAHQQPGGDAHVCVATDCPERGFLLPLRYEFHVGGTLRTEVVYSDVRETPHDDSLFALPSDCAPAPNVPQVEFCTPP